MQNKPIQEAQLPQRHDVLFLLKSYHLLQNCTKITFVKAYNRQMTLKVTEGDRNCCYDKGDRSLPINAP